ncbi:MAG: Rdx family protein [Phycisphaerales bacterium]|nr:Rdx family protein [Phycisphaerales bacterium]
MAELTEKYGSGLDVETIVGDGGVFEVVVDGEKVYSKKETGQFPRYGEVPMAIDMKMVNQ